MPITQSFEVLAVIRTAGIIRTISNSLRLSDRIAFKRNSLSLADWFIDSLGRPTIYQRFCLLLRSTGGGRAHHSDGPVPGDRGWQPECNRGSVQCLRNRHQQTKLRSERKLTGNPSAQIQRGKKLLLPVQFTLVNKALNKNNWILIGGENNMPIN